MAQDKLRTPLNSLNEVGIAGFSVPLKSQRFLVDQDGKWTCSKSCPFFPSTFFSRYVRRASQSMCACV